MIHVRQLERRLGKHGDGVSVEFERLQGDRQTQPQILLCINACDFLSHSCGIYDMYASSVRTNLTITLAWATLNSSIGTAICIHTCTYICSHSVARNTHFTQAHLLVSQPLAIISDQSFVAALPYTQEVAHQIQHGVLDQAKLCGAEHAVGCDQTLCGDFYVCFCSRANTTHTTASQRSLVKQSWDESFR